MVSTESTESTETGPQILPLSTSVCTKNINMYKREYPK